MFSSSLLDTVVGQRGAALAHPTTPNVGVLPSKSPYTPSSMLSASWKDLSTRFSRELRGRPIYILLLGLFLIDTTDEQSLLLGSVPHDYITAGIALHDLCK